MAEESFQLPSEQSLDYHIVQLFDRLEGMRREKQNGLQIVGGRLAPVRPSMQAEIRTVEFWRYVVVVGHHISCIPLISCRMGMWLSICE